ncbi:hypothetical protein V1525DRAFT_411525 [Lipomyces kononenkoae]|uniref:Uncharacterized protein n=1 Tax=Lipomyces kononenkoae TaxID=34357 RepID=A0ACC3STJ3_LIPKO
MFQALRKRVAPRGVVRRIEAKTKYGQSLRSPVDAWIEGCERADPSAKGQNIPKVQDNEAVVYEFIKALSPNSRWVRYRRIFRTDWRKRKAEILYERTGSFAITLQGREGDILPDREGDILPDTKKACLYGKNH